MANRFYIISEEELTILLQQSTRLEALELSGQYLDEYMADGADILAGYYPIIPFNDTADDFLDNLAVYKREHGYREYNQYQEEE